MQYVGICESVYKLGHTATCVLVPAVIQAWLGVVMGGLKL